MGEIGSECVIYEGGGVRSVTVMVMYATILKIVVFLFILII